MPGCARPMRSPRWPRAGSTLWLPTSTTLQQLEHVASLDEIRERLAPGLLGPVLTETVDDAIVRIVMPAGGGVAGQPVCAYLVGRRRFVLVDPGDPTGPGLARALALAAERGGPIEAVALTHVDPDHAAGAEAVAERLGVPVLTGPGGGRPLPYDVREVDDLRPARRPATSPCAPSTRPARDRTTSPSWSGDGRFVLAGDLDGVRGARSVTAPPDEAAWAASRERLARLAPGATWLAGHPTPDTPG